MWSINELALVPRPKCPECSKTNVDGMIHCVHCGHRLEPQGDLANALSTFKEKAAAAREGRPIDFVKMSPNYDINTNRLRSQQREGDFRDVNSAGSTLRQRCHQVKKKSINNNDTTISDVMHKRPFEAYNYAAKGLSITSLAQIERLAAVRRPPHQLPRQVLHDRRDGLPLSVPEKERDDRLQLPAIMLSRPLDDILEGLAGLGERQLFALIENTRFGTYKRDHKCGKAPSPLREASTCFCTARREARPISYGCQH